MSGSQNGNHAVSIHVGSSDVGTWKSSSAGETMSSGSLPTMAITAPTVAGDVRRAGRGAAR